MCAGSFFVLHEGSCTWLLFVVCLLRWCVCVHITKDDGVAAVIASSDGQNKRGAPSNQPAKQSAPAMDSGFPEENMVEEPVNDDQAFEEALGDEYDMDFWSSGPAGILCTYPGYGNTYFGLYYTFVILLK